MAFFDALDGYGDSPAVFTDSGTTLSYGDLSGIADAIRGAMQPRSLVFVRAANHEESLAGYLGCLRGRIVPLLLGAESEPRLDALIEAYAPEYFWLPRSEAPSLTGFTEVFGAERYVLCRADRQDAPPLHPDLALLLSTSGSTGSPALVRLSYGNLCSNASAIAESLAITADDRPITTLPMQYTYGLSILNSHILRGCAIVLTARSIAERGFWRRLSSDSASTFGGVPYTYEMLKRLRFSTMTVPSLRMLTQAGGKLALDLSLEFAQLCAAKKIRFVVMYGQTEATARMSYLPSEYAVDKAGSIGIAIPGGALWLEDESGVEITADDTDGELVFRGPNVSMGYAERRADLARGDENGGVLRTGDLARRDAAGFYYITGRKKRMLKLFGNRVNLDEVERLLAKEGWSCACAGTDDHLRVFTVSAAGPEVIRRWLAQQLGIHPTAFEVIPVDALPRSESGKILYSALA